MQRQQQLDADRERQRAEQEKQVGCPPAAARPLSYPCCIRSFAMLNAPRSSRMPNGSGVPLLLQLPNCSPPHSVRCVVAPTLRSFAIALA